MDQSRIPSLGLEKSPWYKGFSQEVWVGTNKVEESLVTGDLHTSMWATGKGAGVEMWAESHLGSSQPLSGWKEPTQACLSSALPLPS